MSADLDSLLDGPPRHLERFAPPWAADRRTICGRPLADVGAWLPFEDGRKLVEKVGRTRAALLFCQTCVSQQGRNERPGMWDANPVVVVHDYSRHIWKRDAAFEQTRAELLSLARLVAAHRDEYDAMVAAYTHDEISARRKAKTS